MTATPESTTDLSALVGSWTLDPARTTVTFHTKAMWVLNVTGSIKAMAGAGTVGPDGSVTGSLVLDAATVDTKNAKRDKHLQTADFFEVATYPTMTFAASGARPEGAGRVQVDGTLTIHGTDRPLTVPAQVTVSGATATATAEFDLDRTGWGLTWAKMGAGVANHVLVSAAFVKD